VLHGGSTPQRSVPRRLAWLTGLLALAAGGSLAAILSHACAGQDSGCGNGVVDPGEECDDGNPENDDGCTVLCTQPRCGDGLVDERTEECDDRNADPGDGCDPNCWREGAICGNGTLEATGSWPEECDDGNLNDYDGCSGRCFTEVARCGDGIMMGLEECDDGNRAPGDGCDQNCRTESPDAGDADVVDIGDTDLGDIRDSDADLGEVEAVDGDLGGVPDGEVADADVVEVRDGWECHDPVCDFIPQCGCPDGQKCTLVGAERGCVSNGFLAEGRACSSDEECAIGLLCAPAVGSDVPLCHRFCEVADDCLGPGSRCVVPVTGGSTVLCSVSCELDSGSGCPAETRCKLFQESDGSYLTDCTGDVGSGRVGHACEDDGDCASGFFCAAPDFPTCVQYCPWPDGYCEGGFVCQPFSPAVSVGSSQYGYCG
jgi:cysteine-rich repeat protein